MRTAYIRKTKHGKEGWDLMVLKSVNMGAYKTLLGTRNYQCIPFAIKETAEKVMAYVLEENNP